MISDDTEHTCMVAQALLASAGEPDAFARSLAWRLRGWLAALPAGTGLTTAQAIIRLWLGFSWRCSGVYSAGNGPAMRAGLLGLFAGDDDRLLRDLVYRCTRITHTDPRAEEGALLVALAARHGARRGAGGVDPEVLLAESTEAIRDSAVRDSISRIGEFVERNASAFEFADALGLQKGVSGYILHTVPVCLFCWLRHRDDFRAGVEAVIRLGGDTDSTGAIVGALLGATLGAQAIPGEWLEHLCDWPRSVSWMQQLADRLGAFVDRGVNEDPLPLFWPGLLPRNLAFFAIVLTHGFRRLLPPY